MSQRRLNLDSWDYSFEIRYIYICGNRDKWLIIFFKTNIIHFRICLFGNALIPKLVIIKCILFQFELEICNMTGYARLCRVFSSNCSNSTNKWTTQRWRQCFIHPFYLFMFFLSCMGFNQNAISLHIFHLIKGLLWKNSTFN